MKKRENISPPHLNWSFAIPWAVAHKAPLFMEFSWQEYWSELLFSAPGDIPDPGIKPGFPTLQADSLPSEPSAIVLVKLNKNSHWQQMKKIFKISKKRNKKVNKTVKNMTTGFRKNI